MNKFRDGEEVDIDRLKSLGWVRSNAKVLKVLGRGEINVSLVVKASKFSKSAKEKIVSAGGTVIVV